MTHDGGHIDRRAARVLLLDPDGRVLMLHGWDPARPSHTYWFTVGGGLEPGETLLDAAVRQAFEETGLRLSAADLVGPVRTDTVSFPFDGEWFSQEQEFFVARASATEAGRRPMSSAIWRALAIRSPLERHISPFGR